MNKHYLRLGWSIGARIPVRILLVPAEGVAIGDQLRQCCSIARPEEIEVVFAHTANCLCHTLLHPPRKTKKNDSKDAPFGRHIGHVSVLSNRFLYVCARLVTQVTSLLCYGHVEGPVVPKRQ